MRRISVVILATLLTLGVWGCARTNLYTASENTARVKRNMERDCRSMASDWNRFWMVDEPSRLTPEKF